MQTPQEEIVNDLKRLTNLTGVVVISPEMATKIIQQCGNKFNRNISKQNVESLAEDFTNGRMEIDTHHRIAFSDTGFLLNGHHRIHACIVSNVPLVVYADFDKPDSAFYSFDTHKSRSVADLMTINGKMAGDPLQADRKTQDVLSFLARRVSGLTHRSDVVNEQKILYEVYKPDLIDLNAAYASKKKGMSSPNKAPFILRLHDAAGYEREMLLDQWTALAKGEHKSFDDTTSAFKNWSDNYQGTDQIEIGVRSWRAWDANKRNLTRLQQKVPNAVVLGEMREAMTRHKREHEQRKFFTIVPSTKNTPISRHPTQQQRSASS